MDGEDALVKRDAEGNEVKPELGYEKIRSGPTSNFVGTHMPQGAIELVQSELQRQDPFLEARKARKGLTMQR